MFDLERDSAIDASIMTLTALSVKAAPYQGALNLLLFRSIIRNFLLWRR